MGSVYTDNPSKHPNPSRFESRLLSLLHGARLCSTGFPPPPFTTTQLFFGSVSLPRGSSVMKGAASRWVLRLATEIPSSGLPERTDAQERLQPTPCCDQFRLSRDVRKNSLSLALSVSTRDRASFYTVSRMYGGIGLTTASLLLLTVYILSCRRLHIYPKFLILLIFPPSCYLLYPFFWVIPRRLNFICRRFGTLCLFHLYRQVVV